MKNILFFLLLTFAAQTVVANQLWFGANTSSYKLNEFCEYSLSVPTIKPRFEGEMPPGIAQLNLEWQEDIVSAVNDFNKNTNKENEPDACNSFGDGYQVNYSFNIKTNLASPITSIEMLYYWYTGGAHGNTSTSATTFVTASGKKINSLADFLEESGLDAFKNIVEQELLNQEVNLDFGWNNFKKQWSSMTVIKNFYIGLNGEVVITFDPYDVGPYAQGPISVTVYAWQLSEEVKYNSSDVAQMLKKMAGSSIE